jgi:hypothetical protein
MRGRRLATVVDTGELFLPNTCKYHKRIIYVTERKETVVDSTNVRDLRDIHVGRG